MFGSIGMPELIIIFVIALDHFRPPEAARARAVRSARASAEFKRASNELKNTLEEEIRIEEQQRAGRGRPRRQRRAASTHRRPADGRSRGPSPEAVRRARRPSDRHGARALSRARSRGRSSSRRTTTRTTTSSGGKMSFLEHLDELRKRIVNACHRRSPSASASASSSSSGSSTSSWRRRWPRSPRAARMIYTQPSEAFSLYITVSLIVGHRLRRAVHHVAGLAVHRAGAVHEREEARHSVRAASRRCGFVGGAAFNHYVAFPFIMIVLRQLQLAGPALHAAAERRVRALHEDAARHRADLPDADRRVLPRAGCSMVTARFLVKQFKIRRAHHLHRRRRHHAGRRPDGPGDHRRARCSASTASASSSPGSLVQNGSRVHRTTPTSPSCIRSCRAPNLLG